MVFDEQVVKRLLECDWLVNCGRTDAEIPGVRCEWLTDRERIVKNFNGVKWENTRIDARNEVTSYLSLNQPNQFNGVWNKRVDMVKEQFLPKIKEIYSAKVIELELPERVSNAIDWDVLNIIVISSYREYIMSNLYNNLLDIYTSGHLPCGWHGRYPKGVIMVY